MASQSYVSNTGSGSTNALASRVSDAAAMSETDQFGNPPVGENPDEMSESQFSASVKSCIDDAVDYIDGFIAPARATATQYYRGDLFGNEEEGRSQIVMTEVRDTIQAIIPSLLRIFTSSDEIVGLVFEVCDGGVS